MQRPDQGDELVPKSPKESAFEKAYAPGAKPGTPLKLGSVDYGADLHDSPLMRTIKRALVGWQLPAAPPALGRTLKDDDPRLLPTARRPGREAWRKALEELLVSAGAVEARPCLYACEPAVAARLLSERVLPGVVRADVEHLLTLVPEHSELVALGEGRSAGVVRDEAEAIGAAAFAAALAQKRDVLCGLEVARLQQAKAAGFRRVVVTLGARDLDALVKESDELVLLAGEKLEVLAQAKGGQLLVKNERALQQLRAAK